MNELKECELIPPEYRYEGEFQWYDAIKTKDFVKWLENIPDNAPVLNIKNIDFWTNYVFYIEINGIYKSVIVDHSNNEVKIVKDIKDFILSQEWDENESEVECANNIDGIIGFKYDGEKLIAVSY